MDKYKKTIADNDNVEMIQVSLDQDKGKALAWAAKEKFPWLTVLPEDVKASGLSALHTSGGVPCYVLVDKEGKVVVEGTHDPTKHFEKIKAAK